LVLPMSIARINEVTSLSWGKMMWNHNGIV